jgi:signal transduction histidine kinase/ligand-binding sensor domain-containing protein
MLAVLHSRENQYLNLFLFLFIFPFINVHSQTENYSFQQIFLEQGLPGTNVTSQFQDHNGIMWIAVEGMGLCKYDGHSFDVFRNEPSDTNSISCNFINDIAEDKNGNLWVATDFGLNMLDKKHRRFKHFFNDKYNPQSLSDDVTNTLFLDNNGFLWIGTNKGLSILKPNNKNFENHFNTGNSQFTINVINKSNLDTYWIGTAQGLIKYNYKKNQFKQWKKAGLSENEPIHDRIIDINFDKLGTMWIATHKGLDRFNLKTEKFIHWKFENKDLAEYNQEGIHSIFQFNDTSIWAGTYSKGIIIINPIHNTYFTIHKDAHMNNPLHSDHIQYIMKDNTGIVWVGTKFGGVFKYLGNNIIFSTPGKFALMDEISNKYTMSFERANDDIYWVGTKFEGLYKINIRTNKIENFKYQPDNKKSINSNRIQTILKDSQNNLWIGSENGMDLFLEDKKYFEHYSNVPINTIIEDKSGILWVGSRNGVYIIDKINKQLKPYNLHKHPELFSNKSLDILGIFQDSKNNIWFSTRFEGLYQFNPVTGSFKYFSKSNKKGDLTDNMIRPVFEDSKGNIWIGTKGGGLFRYYPKKEYFKSITMKDGLPSNFILGIKEDNSGNLWLGTNNGLARYNPQTGDIVNFNNDNGLKSNILELGLCYHFKSGEILVGGSDGFNIFDPSRVNKISKDIKCIATQIKVFEDQIAMDIEKDTTIYLNYNKNYISVEFTINDYSHPSRHKYFCYMKGIDNGWVNLDNKNFKSYTNLEPGTYQLILKGSNELGNYSRNKLVITFVVKPAFYQTWGFRILLFVFILLCVGVYILNKAYKNKQVLKLLEIQIKERTQKLEDACNELILKNNRIEEQNIEIDAHRTNLEKTVHERTRDLEIAKERAEESERLKTSFLANMSHEIRTPLNAITGFSMLLNDPDVDIETRIEYQQIIQANTNSLLKLVEDILDLSKIEAGQLVLKNETFDLNQIIQELYVMFSEELKVQNKSNIELKCNNLNDGSKILIYTDQYRFRQIFINLISNAIKYTHQGEITFGYKVIGQNLEIFVKDTGIGISQKDQEKIFNRFVKVEENNMIYRGTGLGLSIVKNIVNLIGGELTVISEVNQGSTFICTLNKIVSVNTPSFSNFSGQTGIVDVDVLKNKTILIAEDEDSNVLLLWAILNKLCDKLLLAYNGSEALEICRRNHIDLVLMDIKMPIMDGMEAISYLKKEFPNLIVIAQTAYAMEEDKIKIIEAGFNDYIAKPIIKEILLDKIVKILE